MDGVAFLAASVGDFAHGQTGRAHHLPFRMPRDFPAHQSHDIPELMSSCGQPGAGGSHLSCDQENSLVAGAHTRGSVGGVPAVLT